MSDFLQKIIDYKTGVNHDWKVADFMMLLLRCSKCGTVISYGTILDKLDDKYDCKLFMSKSVLES